MFACTNAMKPLTAKALGWEDNDEINANLYQHTNALVAHNHFHRKPQSVPKPTFRQSMELFNKNKARYLIDHQNHKIFKLTDIEKVKQSFMDSVSWEFFHQSFILLCSALIWAICFTILLPVLIWFTKAAIKQEALKTNTIDAQATVVN